MAVLHEGGPEDAAQEASFTQDAQLLAKNHPRTMISFSPRTKTLKRFVAHL